MPVWCCTVSQPLLRHSLVFSPPLPLIVSLILSFPPRVHIFVFYRIVKLTPSPVTTVLTKHSKYTSRCLYVYYCVAQVSAWQSRNKWPPKNGQKAPGNPADCVSTKIKPLKNNNLGAEKLHACFISLVWHFGKYALLSYRDLAKCICTFFLSFLRIHAISLAHHAPVAHFFPNSHHVPWKNRIQPPKS